MLLLIRLWSDFFVILEDYTVWAEHCFGAKIPEVVVCGAVFSEADDRVDLVCIL